MQPTSSLAKAALWTAGWLSLMVIIAVAGREATHELAIFQIMVMRSVIGIVLLYPLVHAAGGLGAMKTRRLPWHVLRNSVHYGAQYGWFAALTLIPLAQVVAIEFTMPIWTALLAAAFLGERLTWMKLVAVALGIVGVALIVKPAAGTVNAGQLIALGAAVGFALSVTMTKSLTRTDSTVQIIFWMLVLQSLIGIAPALAVWRWPSAAVWPWVLVIAFCGTFSHYCLARALSHADATVVVPMDFARVPLTALAGWLVYAEKVDLLTVAGTVLILGANVLNLQRQRRLALNAVASDR
jgi:drug/metabolite transporter (DMT)-like permease